MKRHPSTTAGTANHADEVRKLQRRIRQLENLLDVCDTLSSSLNLRTTLLNIGQLCRTLLKARAASIMLLDERRKVLQFEVVTDEKGKRLRGMEVCLGEGIAGRVAETGQPIVVPDCQEEPRHASRFDQISGFVTRSLLAVPLVARGRIVGVMEALNKRAAEGAGTPYFDNDDLELAMSMASLAAAAVMNAQLFEEVKQQQAQTVQAGKLAALGTIASGIAHELNQPLTGILGFVQLLQHQMQKGSVNQDLMLEHLGLIEKQVHRMTAIIGHVRTFARPEPAVGLVDVNQVVRDAVMLMREQIRAHDIALEMRLAPELPSISGDAVRLEEVLINLLANARDAIEERLAGAAENAAPAPRRISVSTTLEPSRLVIEVEDTGTGIPADVLPRIFDPFFTTRGHGKGTGLGLSITHGIIRDHGGSIEVESRLGEGTTFYVYLPLDTQPTKEKEDL